MDFRREDIIDGLNNLNALLSYIKRVEGTKDFPVIVSDWNLLDEKQKTIVALMAMSKLAEYLIKENKQS